MKKIIEKIVDDILELISAPFDIELQDLPYDELLENEDLLENEAA